MTKLFECWFFTFRETGKIFISQYFQSLKYLRIIAFFEKFHNSFVNFPKVIKEKKLFAPARGVVFVKKVYSEKRLQILPSVPFVCANNAPQ